MFKTNVFAALARDLGCQTGLRFLYLSHPFSGIHMKGVAETDRHWIAELGSRLTGSSLLPCLRQVKPS